MRVCPMRALKPKAGIINNIWEIAFAPAKIIWKTLLTYSYYINKRQASVGFFPCNCQRHTHSIHTHYSHWYSQSYLPVFAAKVRFDKRGECLIENYSEFVCAGLINNWSCLRINRNAIYRYPSCIYWNDSYGVYMPDHICDVTYLCPFLVPHISNMQKLLLISKFFDSKVFSFNSCRLSSRLHKVLSG